MPHIEGEEVGSDQIRCGRDQIVGGINAAMGLSLSLGQRAGDASDLLVNGDPRERGAEQFELVDLALAHS
jgi:hypothetical protein